MFSWDVDTRLLPDKPLVEPTLTIFEPLDKGAGMASYPFPYCLTMNNWGDGGRTQYQVFYSVEVDSWTDPPTVWLSTERTIGYGPGTSQGYENLQRKPFETIGVKLLQLKDGRWTEVLDFGRETKRSIGIADPAKHGVEHLLVNAADGTLYDALYGAPLLRIDPESGAIAEIKGPPGGPGDLFTIGPDGLLYSVYEGGWLVRWDPATNREVPFDYGMEIPEADGQPVARSAIRLPGGHLIEFHGHWPGVNVGEDGRIACFTWSMGQQVIHQGDSFFRKEVREFTPTVYPGRSIDHLVSVWDRYGKPFFLRDTCTLVKFDPKRTRILTSARAPVPLVLKSGFNTFERKVQGREVPTALDALPQRPQDVEGYWLEGAEWCYGGVGFMSRSQGQNECWCLNANFALDRLGRSFVPETSHYTIAVLDANGNLMLRIGQYGNEEDGVPLVRKGASPNARSIGGDEVALCQPLMVGVYTDRRLFVSDPGNARLISVKLDYHASERVSLRDVPDAKP